MHSVAADFKAFLSQKPKGFAQTVQGLAQVFACGVVGHVRPQQIGQIVAGLWRAGVVQQVS